MYKGKKRDEKEKGVDENGAIEKKKTMIDEKMGVDKKGKGWGWMKA